MNLLVMILIIKFVFQQIEWLDFSSLPGFFWKLTTDETGVSSSQSSNLQGSQLAKILIYLFKNQYLANQNNCLPKNL